MNADAKKAFCTFQKLVKKSRQSKYGSQFAPWLVQPGSDAPWEAVERHIFEYYFRKDWGTSGNFTSGVAELLGRGSLAQGTAEELFPNSFWGMPGKPVICSPRFAAWLRAGQCEVWETAW